MVKTSLEKRIGHVFKDRSLLEESLTHSSTASGRSYERLEFLGDRVLGLAIADILYKTFPSEPEGHLAKRLAALVQGEMLAKIAQEIDLGSYINLSDAESQAGGAKNENILADVFEAVVGALYLDAGFGACETLIQNLWNGKLDQMKAPPQHPKTGLQEWAQARGLNLPIYEVVGQSGPDHAPEFEIRLIVDGFPAVHAFGRTRQAAEKKAAADFLNLHGD